MKFRLIYPVLILFISSLVLLFWAADREPFLGQPSILDGFFCVGLGTLLIACWISLVTVTMWLKLNRKLNPLYLGNIPISLVAIFYLHFVVLGYLEDMVTNYKLISSGI